MTENSQKSATGPAPSRVIPVKESLSSTAFYTEFNLDLSSLPNLPLQLSNDANLTVTIKRNDNDSFSITWTSTDLYSVQARHSRSAADLYRIDPAKKERLWLASVIGEHHNCWPAEEDDWLQLSFHFEDLEAVKNRVFNWKKKQTYLARLYFFSDRLRLKDSAPELAQARELVFPRSISSYISTSTPNDVRFVFRKKSATKELSFWSSSSVLIQNSSYFERLLNSDFAESKVLSDSTREKQQEEEVLDADSEMTEDSDDDSSVDADSDHDLDEVFETPESTSSPNPNLAYRRVEIADTSFTTYRAVLVWIQTGYISFSPLTSSFSHLPHETRKLARTESITARHELDPLLPLSASPKSVYKLAHLFSLPALETLALDELSRQLTIDNVFIELFDSFASTYDEARKLEVEFAVKNKKGVKQSKSFKDTVGKIRRNELSLSGPVVADLLSFFAE